MKTNWTDKFLEFIETNDNALFTEIYNNVKKILISQFNTNEYFRQDNCNTFDDIYQKTMMKVFINKHTFNPKYGNFITFVTTIFSNTLKDVIKTNAYKKNNRLDNYKKYF